jgi:hypothetical protein
MWQTRPQGEVWGASIKGPAAIVTKIPTFIRADYTNLLGSREVGIGLSKGADAVPGQALPSKRCTENPGQATLQTRGHIAPRSRSPSRTETI